MAKHAGVKTFAQSMVEYVEDLITASPKESFTKIEMLLLLNAVKNDRSMMATLDLCDRAIFGSGSTNPSRWEEQASF